MKTLRYIQLVVALFAITAVSAQNFSVGLRFSHLYDLYEGHTEQTNGFTDFDMRGGHSSANIDFSYGLSTFYHFSDKFTMDLNAEFGSMSGGFEHQYYKSSITLISVGANINLGSSVDKTKWPYLRVSAGTGLYDSKRYFTNEDIAFSGTNGVAIQNGVGLGYNILLGTTMTLRIGTDANVSWTDAWDGYENDKGTDFFLRTGFSLAYTFDTNEAKYKKINTP